MGIGTTTPGYKLDVQDNVNNFLVSRLYNTNAGNNAQSISQLATGIPNTWANSLVHNNAGTPFYHLTTGTGIRNAYFSMPNYNFRNQTGSTLMAITATGYVGINTAPDTRVRFKVGGNVNIGTIPQPANPEWYDLQV